MENYKDMIKYHYEKQVIKSVNMLFSNYDIDKIAKVYDDMIYYISYPESAKELEIEDLKSLYTSHSDIMHLLISVYANYRDME